MVDLDNIDPYLLQAFGFVRSKLKRREDFSKQGYRCQTWTPFFPALPANKH
jgi:hypothetical protein